MKKALVFILILSIGSVLWAQQKFALVIGNANYTGVQSLRNPVNDANAMEAALRNLGFTVEKVLNGNLDQMEAAIIRLKNQLSRSSNTYGFFFYAGHGVQSLDGDNYLIPVNASTILSDSHLRQRAVSLQTLLENLGEAGNELNMVVLDSCRDNPFDWARNNRSAGNSRGLYPVSHAPSGSIVMYAAAAGQTADDGTGSNGLFTGYLLNNLRTAGLSVFEVFDRTMGNVISATGGAQRPEMSIRYPGANLAYLGTRPPNPDPIPPVSLYNQLVNATGTVTITVTQTAELPRETVISRASTITLRGDTASRTVLGSGSDHLIKIERGVTLILENITLRGVGIWVYEGGTLVMNNAATITGCTHPYNWSGVRVFGGTFTMSGGTISANDHGVSINGGTFTMSGGTISNNTNWGVSVSSDTSYGNGTFTMSGGTISNNTGNGVQVDSTFTMRGGTISGNTSGDGGGVRVRGTFTMSGGTISGNTARDDGGGVNVGGGGYGGTFTMSGGTISGNRAGSAGGGVYVYGTFRMTGGTIYGSNGGSNANRAGGSLINGHAVFQLNPFLVTIRDLTIRQYP